MRGPALFVLLTVALAGCGDETTPEDEVRGAVARYGKATADRDAQTLCDELLAPKLKQNAEQYGLPCELAVKPALEAAKDPRLTVRTLTVKGDDARVAIRTTAANQPPADATLTLRRITGEWRIAAQR